MWPFHRHRFNRFISKSDPLPAWQEITAGIGYAKITKAGPLFRWVIRACLCGKEKEDLRYEWEGR